MRNTMLVMGTGGVGLAMVMVLLASGPALAKADAANSATPAATSAANSSTPATPATAANSSTLAATAEAASSTPRLQGPPQKIVEAAKGYSFIRYNRKMKGGAYTNGAFSGSSCIVLGLAAWAGNETADARLLEQVRYSLQGENCICCNGGYPAQHERHVAGMFTLLRQTPRLWKDQLPDAERRQITLLMKASLVASAFTTSDAGAAANKGQEVSLDGDDNLSRGWNPNFREGMIGAMIVGTVFFGGGPAAHRLLDSYDHEAFVAELKAAGLTNTYETFNWKAAHPASPAPTGQAITAAIRNYRYLGNDLNDPMVFYYLLTEDTYNGTVAAGYDGGKGVKMPNGQVAGIIVSGAEGLPNKGQRGQLKELNARDGGGPRSSLHYAYDGFRPNLTNHIILVAGGFWKPGPRSTDCVKRINVGVTDLFYKLEHGYRGYSKGHGGEVMDLEEKGFDFELTRSLWEDVVRPYHREILGAGK